MPIKILMPALSPTMTEGNLARWVKKEGEEVRSGDVIAEIETDKATMEVEAVDEGKLGKILVAEGTEGVKVNATIALLLEEGEDAGALEGAGSGNGEAAPSTEPETKRSEAPPASPGKGGEASDAPDSDARTGQVRGQPSVSAVQQPTASNQPAAKSGNGAAADERTFVSPLARRMAEQAGLDLRSLQGSGPHGRIIKVDVEAAMRGGAERPAQQPQPQAEPATVTPSGEARPEQPGAAGPPSPAVADLTKPTAPYTEAYEEVPLSNMRKVIAKRLTEAKQTIPHFYLTMDVELDALLAMRAQLNGREGADYKLSVNDFVIKAVAIALRKVPNANAAWGGDKIYVYKDIDVSVAVAIEGGLITPIIRKADGKGLSTISNEMKDLAARAKEGKLKPEEFQGGGFSISNLGMFGIKDFAAVINPPQACILAVGAGEKRPVVKNDALAIATMMSCTLSVDHRAVDGALGAQFLAEFKKLVQDPMALLL